MPILFPLNTLRPGSKSLGVPPTMRGALPLPAVGFRISGVTRDSLGSPLAGCSVALYRTADDRLVDRVVSDAGGAYAFTSPSVPTAYYVVAYKAGGGDVAGTTANTVVAA